MVNTIYPNIAAYHNIAALRNEAGELMDDQTVFITVELPKFGKSPTDIVTDLDKLLYTMKTLHNAPAYPIQWPEFWDEEWIKLAMKELSLRNMDPEELLLYQVTMAKNAHAFQVVNKQLAKAEQDGLQRDIEQGVEAGKRDAGTTIVENLLRMQVLTVDQIAVAAEVSVAFVVERSEAKKSNQ